MMLQLRQDNRGRHKLTPRGKDPSSSPRCGSLERTNSATNEERSTIMPRTMNNYVASTPRVPGLFVFKLS
jgi:hypothetical protein